MIKLAGALLALLALVATGVAPGQSSSDVKPIAVDPRDLPLTVRGTVGQTEYRTTIRLQATGAEVPTVAFLYSDLVSTDDPSVTLGRGNLDLVGLKALKPNDAIDASVVVKNAPRAGSYIGEIEIYPSGQRSQALVLPITVLVSPRPVPTDQIQVDPTPISIEARIGEEPTFKETLFLKSSGATISGFQLHPGHLVSDDGKITLPRSAIELVGGSKELPEGEYVPVDVKVSGITKPARYSGEIVFVPRDQPRERGTRVLMTVNAKGVPSLTAVAGTNSDKIDVKLTRCVTCTVERWAGASDDVESRTLDFDTPARVPVTITSARVIARGERSSDVLDTGQVQVASAADGVNTLAVTVSSHANKIPPDRYTGRLKLTLDDSDSPVVIPVTIAVKEGPLKALVAIIFGILGALIFRAWTRQNDRWRGLESIDSVQKRAQTEAPEDWRRVVPALERARNAVLRGAADVAAEIVKTVDNRITVLVDTRTIERAFPAYRDRLEQVRDLIEAEDDTHAKDRLTEIRDEIAQGKPPAQPDHPAITEAIAASAQAIQHSHRGTASRGGASRFRRSVAYYTAGVNDWTAAMSGRTFAVPLRVFFGIVTLAVTAVVALKAQYLGGSDTFGADPFWDYFALVVAGFTGTVTQKVIVNAKPAKV